MSAQEVRLGYRYAPVPHWIIDAHAEGDLTALQRDILVALYHHARTTELTRRGETPHLSLERLATTIRYDGQLDSLRRELSRMRSNDLLSYRTTGNARTGYRYLFKLDPDRKAASDHRPASKEADKNEHSLAERSALRIPRPTRPSPRPRSERTATPLYERDDAPLPKTACPTFLDVRDETNIGSEGEKEGRASLHYEADSQELKQESLEDKIAAWDSRLTRAGARDEEDNAPRDASEEQSFLVELRRVFIDTGDAEVIEGSL